MAATNTVTKIDRVLAAFENGETLTTKQIRSRFGFASRNSVHSAVNSLRNRGYAIYTNESTNSKGETVNRYRLGNPTRAMVAAGIEALRIQGVNPFTR